MIYLQLFICYLKIGFFGFGGGYSMLSLIHHEVVTRHEWISAAALNDIIAISQMTPGPIAINSATYIGYTVAGFWGSVVATASVCLPSLTIMVLITRFFLSLKENIYMKRVMTSMRPAVIGMIGAASMLLIFPEDQAGASMIDLWSWLIFAVAFVASLLKFDPIKLIVLSAVAGISIYYLPTLGEPQYPEGMRFEEPARPFDQFDMLDAQVITSPEFEQQWAEYIYLLMRTEPDLAAQDIYSTAQLCAASPEAHLALMDLGEKYLYNPNSPLRNDELFIPILESIVASSAIDESLKIRPSQLLAIASRNRLGTIAADFELPQGGTMHSVAAPYTLLYFFDDHCADCKRTSDLLGSSQLLEQLTKEGTIATIKVAASPSSSLDTLYDLKAIPTLYLLDAQKRVVMKDVSAESILNILPNI